MINSIIEETLTKKLKNIKEIESEIKSEEDNN